MSFIGSIGTLMANTGLEEIMKAAFSGVPHMLSGKKFPKNARALRMVVKEVILSIVQNVTSAEELVVSLEVKAGESKTTMVWVNCLIKLVFLMMLYVRADVRQTGHCICMPSKKCCLTSLRPDIRITRGMVPTTCALWNDSPMMYSITS